MRILIIGFVVFVIWSIFSVWLYVDKIKPALNKPEAVQEIPETQTNFADSVMQKTALRPNDLIIYFEFDDTEFKPDNKILGLKRAQNIQKYLESKDIEAGKMITESKGEDQPVADQDTEEGRAMNRRAVLTIKK